MTNDIALRSLFETAATPTTLPSDRIGIRKLCLAEMFGNVAPEDHAGTVQILRARRLPAEVRAELAHWTLRERGIIAPRMEHRDFAAEAEWETHARLGLS